MRLKNRHQLTPLRQNLRTHGTMHEAAMWLMLKGRQIEGVRFRRQFSVGAYILDFYCPALKLCIELDGAHHFTEEGMAHDARRTAFLQSHGITVLRFENCTIFNRQQAVLETIRAEVKRLQGAQ